MTTEQAYEELYAYRWKKSLGILIKQPRRVTRLVSYEDDLLQVEGAITPEFQKTADIIETTGVPAHRVRRMLPQLLKRGKVVRAGAPNFRLWAGVTS